MPEIVRDRPPTDATGSPPAERCRSNSTPPAASPDSAIPASTKTLRLLINPLVYLIELVRRTIELTRDPQRRASWRPGARRARRGRENERVGQGRRPARPNAPGTPGNAARGRPLGARGVHDSGPAPDRRQQLQSAPGGRSRGPSAFPAPSVQDLLWRGLHLSLRPLSFGPALDILCRPRPVPLSSSRKPVHQEA